MTIVADESVSHAIVAKLREDGWQVLSIQEVAGGSSDPTVLNRAHDDKAILLTEDKDFGELVYRNRLSHSGVVLIRVDGLRRNSRARVVSEAVREHFEQFVDAFSVITPGGVRIRTGTTDS